MQSEQIRCVADLTDPEKSVIYNMSNQNAVNLLKTGDLKAGLVYLHERNDLE